MGHRRHGERLAGADAVALEHRRQLIEQLRLRTIASAPLASSTRAISTTVWPHSIPIPGRIRSTAPGG
jgi:hypothetical protein